MARPVCAYRPDLLDIVKATDFGAEEVHDDIAHIDQDPITKPLSFSMRMRCSAKAPTWRCERPEAMMRLSATEDLPVRSITTISWALSSSSLWTTKDSNDSDGATGADLMAFLATGLVGMSVTDFEVDLVARFGFGATESDADVRGRVKNP